MKTMNRKQIIDYLENECAFRDYRFKSAHFWGKSIGKIGIASINLLDPEKYDLDAALNVFARDGYRTVIIYLSKKRGAK